ncbi:DUF4083 domain-containing protein [Peribacillus simplex]
MLYQLVFLIFIFGIFSGVFFLVRSLVTKQPSKSENIEQKLDRIIDLLEKDKKNAKKAVDALFETISNTLAKEEKIQLVGFGTFEVRDRAARPGRNPQTGEEIQIAASKVPAFKPGKELKEAIK